MSHFTVMVIGKDVERQLAPYDENRPGVKHPKWDWYSIGGRWMGYFKLKPGAVGEHGEPGVFNNKAPKGTADICRKSAVDVDGMRAQAGRKASELWGKVHRQMNGVEWPKPWSEVLKAHGDAVEAAREAYHQQPGVRRISESKDRDLIFIDIDEFNRSRSAYVMAADQAALAPFAYVKNGEWHERGEMGWFAMVGNEKEAGAWHKEFNAMWEKLPGNTLLTMVDCHI